MMKICAVAGRRPDPTDAEVVRFPAAAVPVVQARIRIYFEALRPNQVVVSAAAGVDLLVLETCLALNIETEIVLAFAESKFRSESVADRGQVWLEKFDSLMTVAHEKGYIRCLDLDANAEGPYLIANKAMIDTAAQLAGPDQPRALIVWDRVSRGPEDYSANFAELARSRGFAIDEISTLP